MHQHIGLSAGTARIGRMPGCVVEKFEVGLLKINCDAVETTSINIKSVENVRRDRRQTVLCRRQNNYDCMLNIKQSNGQ